MTADVQIGQKFGALSHIWGSPPRSPFSTILPPSRKVENSRMEKWFQISKLANLGL